MTLTNVRVIQHRKVISTRHITFITGYIQGDSNDNYYLTATKRLRVAQGTSGTRSDLEFPSH